MRRRTFLKQAGIAALLPGVPLAWSVFSDVIPPPADCVPTGAGMGMCVPTLIPMFVGLSCEEVIIPTATARPTDTPEPTATYTPSPTSTMAPTATQVPRPTNTPQLTATIAPTLVPTATARPTESPTRRRLYLPWITRNGT